MKKIVYMMAVATALLVVGCKKSGPATVVEIQNTVPPQKVEAEKPAPPEKPAPKAKPLAPSTEYLKGYNDGYYGNWLGPVRWLVTSDYRSGWSAGQYDRLNHLPHKYNP